MKINIIGVAGFTGVGFALFMFIALGTSARAASGTCWFDTSKTCSVSSVGDCGTNDVLPGRNTDCTGGDAIPGSVNTKTEFINFIDTKLSGGTHSRRGAQFIMSATLNDHNKTDFDYWKQVMQRDEITVYRGMRHLDNSSWYDPDKGDFFFDSYATDRDSIIIAYQGTEIIKIEARCGNLSERHGSIDPSATLSASPNETINIDVGNTFTFRQKVIAAGVHKVGNDKFKWDITGESPIGATSTAIDGAAVRVNEPYTINPSQRGTYTRTVSILNKPFYATTGPASATQKVIVRGWDIFAKSWVDGATSLDGRGRVVLKGQPVTFHHQLYSDGAPLHKNIQGDILFNSNTSTSGVHMPDCADDGSTSASCHDYRFSDLDLTVGASNKSASRTYVFNTTGTFCENVKYSISADNNSNPGDNSTEPACVYVVDPRPMISPIEDYEKNPTGMSPPISMTVTNTSIGGYCPPPSSGVLNIVLNWSTTITPGPSNGSASAQYGNGSCGDITTNVSITPAQRDTLNAAVPGATYSYTVAVQGYGAPVSGNIRVVEVPYARFYGNDSYASNGAIVFNTKAQGTTYAEYGAGGATQYAAIARNLLSGASQNVQMPISSAAFRSANNPIRPNGLKAQVSNVTSMPTLDKIKNNLPTPTGHNTVDWGNDGFYDFGSNNANNISNPSVNKKITIRAKNIYINAPIITNVPSGNFNNDNTPVVVLIADGGNIYIDKSVSRIDAILVAIPNGGNDGEIFTCSDGFSAITKDEWDTSCRSNLTINGSVAAKRIIFARTIGSRLMSSDGEDVSTAGKVMSGVGGLDRAAEVINYPSYLYYVTPFLTDSSSSGYESIYDLPPIL